MSEERFTTEELTALFPTGIPMAVLSKLWTCDDGMTIGELRAWVREQSQRISTGGEG